ncbi:MAG: exodeoxyribonuclease VII small subunit [Deltaproteobacteria bacterium]|nr:exodeoxyribonuclease VII small subunit [Deltaproteobacteria bacterium]
MGSDANDLNFEDALKELEETVSQLESGNLTLEEALDLFERGQQLALRCNTQLEEATLRVKQLTDDGDSKSVDEQ